MRNQWHIFFSKQIGSRRGFALVFVMIIITIFSAAAYSIVSRFDGEVFLANRNAENTATYYWQEGRMRLIRYKFSQEMIINGPTHQASDYTSSWTETDQQKKLNDIINEVMPKNAPFNWRESVREPNGGYNSMGTFSGDLSYDKL